MCNEKLKEEIILFEEIKRRFESYKDNYQIVAIGRTARIGYDILKELYITNGHSNEIEYYERFIKGNLTNIVFNKNLNVSLKKHCLFVWLGIAKIYIQAKCRFKSRY